MTFCPRCGGPVTSRIPPHEDRVRDVCERCGAVHYHNPRVVVGTVVTDGDRVLLCRRAIEPRYGAWTMPAGFLEIGESAAEGARRETREETGVDVRVVAPLVHFDIVRIGQIYMIFRAELVSDADIGRDTESESLEVAWFPWAAIPWDDLAFDATRFTLERARDDRALGRPRLHYGTLRPLEGRTGPWQATSLVDAWSLELERVLWAG